VCLGTRHIAKYCRNKVVSCCEKCGRRNHKAICEYEREERANVNLPTDAGICNSIVEITARLDSYSMDSDTSPESLLLSIKIFHSMTLPVIGQEILNLHTFG
jgi:hypothetical protein